MTKHLEIQEQIPLYALGGLPEADAARVAEHLDICPSCRTEWSEYQFVAAELLEQVPPHAAPAHIAARLQNIIRAEANRAPRQTAPRGVPFWRQPFILPRWAFGFAVLAILLLAGAVAAMGLRVGSPEPGSEQVMQLLSARDIRYVALRTSGAGMDDRGYICISANNAAGLLWLYDLEPLDRDHVYQVWLRRDTLRDNGGTFRPGEDGRAIAVVRAPRPLNQYQEIGITIEPASGSQAPTTPRVIGARFD